MLKYFLIALIVISLVALVGCMFKTAVLGEHKTYEIKSDINSLNVQINAADFVLEHGDKFLVESNLKNLSVTENNGVLTVVDKTKTSKNYKDASLKLVVPEGEIFDKVTISTGAAKLSAKSLSANTLELKTGAGKVEFGNLEVSESVKIKGGAGEIIINGGTLNNLTLNLGVGELNMTAKLLGKSSLKFGVGESNLTLVGSKNDYSFDVKHGVGAITIDGKSPSAFTGSANGENLVKINGGVGATNITFQE